MRNLNLLFLSLCIALGAATLVPDNVHLFLTGNLSTLQVTFSTSSAPSTPGVAYWQTDLPSSIYKVVATASDIHKFTRPTGTVDYITSLTLKSLVRSTSYSYYVFVENDDHTTKSATFTFKSLPEDQSVLNVGIYGDLGAYGSAIVETGDGGLIHWAQTHQFDFIVHNGDLAYNLGSKSGSVGVDFLKSIEPVTSILPYMVTPGNHEFMDSSEPYYNNWFLGQTSLGTTSGSSEAIMWYSFDVGTKLHMIMISTEVYCEDTDNLVAQYKWLEQDLASVRARDEQPWIVAFGHRQIYINDESTLHSRLMRLGLQCTDPSLQKCDYTESCKDGVNCGYSIQELFEKYKVDMYFAGHEHTYVRMYPITSNLTYETQASDVYINPQHTTYIVSGAAGTQSTPSKMTAKSSAAATPTAAAVGGYTFSYFKVYNSSLLSLEQIDVTTGTTVDSFSIEKDSSKPAWTKTTSFALTADTQTVCDQ